MCICIDQSKWSAPTSCLSLFGSIFSVVFSFSLLFFCCWWWWWSLWPLSFFVCYGPRRLLDYFLFAFFSIRYTLYLVTFLLLLHRIWTREKNIEREKKTDVHPIESGVYEQPVAQAIATKSTHVRQAHPFLCKHTNINRHLSNLVRTRRKPPPPTLLCWTQAHKFGRCRHKQPGSSSRHSALSNGETRWKKKKKKRRNKICV